MRYLKKLIAGVGRMRALPVFMLIFAMVFSLAGCGESNEELRETIEQGQQLLGDLTGLMEDAKNLIGDMADAVGSPEGMADAVDSPAGMTDAVDSPAGMTDVVGSPEGMVNVGEIPDGSADVSKTLDGSANTEDVTDAQLLDRDGSYTSKADVALYIHTYGELPDNFMTKKEAEALGWSGGSLEKYAKGMSIGGDKFGNYEGILPKAKGRTYQECDIDTQGKKSRGAKRIVFSNDGLVYYTEDHYESFELLYGEE